MLPIATMLRSMRDGRDVDKWLEFVGAVRSGTCILTVAWNTCLRYPPQLMSRCFCGRLSMPTRRPPSSRQTAW
eukprot:3120569-Prymnesium_polylepis.1